MFVRPCYRNKDGKRHAYWALVESYRTARGPRQRVVAYLGNLDEEDREAMRQAAQGSRRGAHRDYLREEVSPRWVEVDVDRVEIRRCREFGAVWLGWQLIAKLGLETFLAGEMARGREQVPWDTMCWVLVLSRLCDPSSELYIAEHLYARTALVDLLGVPERCVNDDRLYRALDALLPHKRRLESYLKERMGELFKLSYDLLLYDVTSTYFEGEMAGNPQAQRGYSRDKRPDCKQVCIGLVVSRCGMPLGYEVFEGNRHDSKTLQEMVVEIESRYGRADRIWVLDRGMISEKNIEFLKQEGRRYIVGTPRSQLKAYQQELLEGSWEEVHEGLEVQLCPTPNGQETFILCRSAERREKEKAMHERFEMRIEEGLRKLETACSRNRQQPLKIAERVGRLLGRNSRAAGLFTVSVEEVNGRARLAWSKKEQWRQWAELSEGCYMLRSNVTEWTGPELWEAYIQLTEAEAAFRIQKSDLRIRPIWHQKQERIQAHILVCFLAYVLWKTLGKMCHEAGLGDEPRRLFDELGKIRLVDVILPTRNGKEIKRRCVTRPTQHQAILLQRLGMVLPSRMKITNCSEDF